jgi:sulfate/thiosulfate transport system ATP-binding protein
VVLIDGEDMTRVPARRRGIGFCFQDHAPFNHMTVARNVAFGLQVRRRPKAEIRARVDELLEVVRLTGLADRYPTQLSGGQRQRMALARALAIEPRVLLLDEPFGSLDTKVRQELRSWLRELHGARPVTTLLVTHDHEEAMEVADRLAVLNEGRVEQVGPPGELYDRPTTDFVLTFLGPATRLDGVWVRPHDITLHDVPGGDGRVPVTVERVVHLGSEVKVELLVDGGSSAWARLSRVDAQRLALREGERMWADAPGARASEPAPAPVPVAG